MTQTRDFLDRFRPAGAPGGAARAGVPADRVRELAAEVGPVLALLDDVHAECDQILGEARREAARVAAQAHTEVMRIERDGQRRARVARDEAAAAVLAQARAEAQASRGGSGQAGPRRAAAGEAAHAGTGGHGGGPGAGGGGRTAGPGRRGPGRDCRAAAMSAAWVAGSVRARALARRRIGAVAARRLAECGSLEDALHTARAHRLRARDPVRADAGAGAARHRRGHPVGSAGARGLASARRAPRAADAGRLVRDRQR